jgi:putative membrane protein
MAVKLLRCPRKPTLKSSSSVDTAHAIPGVNDKIDEVNSLVSGLAKPTANVVDDLQSLTIALGRGGLATT